MALSVFTLDSCHHCPSLELLIFPDESCPRASLCQLSSCTRPAISPVSLPVGVCVDSSGLTRICPCVWLSSLSHAAACVAVLEAERHSIECVAHVFFVGRWSLRLLLCFSVVVNAIMNTGV